MVQLEVAELHQIGVYHQNPADVFLDRHILQANLRNLPLVRSPLWDKMISQVDTRLGGLKVIWVWTGWMGE